MRRLTTCLLALVVASVGVLGFSGSATRAATTCSYAPVLRGYTITQGIGSYAVLARSKETLVRLYLSRPDCAAKGSDVKLRAASVTASNGTSSATVSPTPSLVPTYPSISAFTAAPAVDLPGGDPIFVLPASITTPPATAPFTLSITAQIGAYEFRTSSTGSYSIVTTPVSYSTFGGAAMQATVEKQTNALGLLVAKMAKSTADPSTWFSSDADAATARAMSTANRMYPVPANVAPLGNAGGLRWSYNNGLVDLSASSLASTLDSTTQKFCGKGSNFPALQTELNGILTVWNSSTNNISAGAVANKIVGVVDQQNSLGSSNGCAEGMAALNTSHAWIRALYGSSPDRSGALAAQETLHASGAVPANRDDNFSASHSPSPDGSADVGQTPYRTFNLTKREYIADDRTVLKLSGTWLNSNTLFEVPDWAFALCRLGGRAGGDCAAAQSGTEGTGTALAAGPAFCMWGTTDGTAATTTIGESWLCDNALQTQAATAGQYWLRLRNAGVTTLTWRVPVSFGSSSDHHGGGAASAIGTFRFAAPYNLDATEWLLCKGPQDDPCQSVLKQQSAPGTPANISAITNVPSGTGTTTGGSVSRSKTVAVPAVEKTLAAKQDVYFLSDTTASMGGAIANAKANATAFLTKLAAKVSDECFGAGDYKDLGDTYIFNNATSFGSCGGEVDSTRRTATSDAINAWAAAGGGDTPEGQWYAMYRWADTLAAFRTGSTRTLIWIGDEPAHDPFCGSLVEPPLGFDITEALLTAKLKERVVTVHPISVGNLNGTPFTGNYPASCPNAGTAGQAARVADATGGTYQNVGSSGTADAIDRALFNKEVVVTPTATCSPGLSVTFTPSSVTLLSGLSTTFNYVVSVAPGTSAGNKQCDIKFLVDGADTGLGDVVTLNVTQHDGPHQFVQATVAGANPDLEAHLTLLCPDAREHVVDVEVAGTTSGGQTTFLSDTSAACPGGGGTFRWTVTNGVHEAVASAGTSTLTPPAQATAVSVDYPNGDTYLQYDNVSLHASVLPLGTAGEWFVDGVSRGTGLHVDTSPGSGGWSAGSHTVTYTVGSVSKSSTFVVEADANNNGVSLVREQQPCVDASGSGAPDSLESADVGSLDPDGDGIPTLDDPDPCAAASSQDVHVELDDILSHLPAEFLRAKLTFPFANALDVDGTSIQIEKIAGIDVSGEAIFDAAGYTVSSGVGTVKWRRFPINTWLRDHGIKNEIVVVAVSGRFKNGTTFRGYDTMRVFLPPF